MTDQQIASEIWGIFGLQTRNQLNLEDLLPYLQEISDPLVPLLTDFINLKTNNSGKITLSQFLEMIAEDYNALNDDVVRKEAFDFIDYKGEGKITGDALFEVAEELKEPLTKDEAYGMVETYNRRNDGATDQQDFKNAVLG